MAILIRIKKVEEDNSQTFSIMCKDCIELKEFKCLKFNDVLRTIDHGKQEQAVKCQECYSLSTINPMNKE